MSVKESKGIRRGLTIVLVVVVLIVSPYVLYITWLLGGSAYHQMIWSQKGSSDYVITSNLNDFSPVRGTSIVTVENGEITAFEMLDGTYKDSEHDLDDFSVLTVDGMFQRASWCAREFPRVVCSFEYDREYGYPKKIKINCPNPDTCQEDYETIDVLDIQLYQK